MIFLLWIGACVAFYLFDAWALMLSVGVIHRDWITALPLLSWHVSLIVVIPLSVIVGGWAASLASGSKK